MKDTGKIYRLIYSGVRVNAMNKKMFSYHNEDNSDTLYFKTRLLGYESIGARIKCFSETGTSFNNHQPEGRIDKTDPLGSKLMEWSLLDRIALSTLKQITIAKQAPNVGVDATIADLRNQLKYLDARDKRKMIDYIIYKLRN